MAQADFKWVNFDTNFNSSTTNASRTFTVDSTPANDTGYLLVQAFDVERGNHRLRLNDKDLPSFDIPKHGDKQWFTWMDRIPPGFLKKGTNKLEILRMGQEDFTVANVAVHWREAS